MPKFASRKFRVPTFPIERHLKESSLIVNYWNRHLLENCFIEGKKITSFSFVLHL